MYNESLYDMFNLSTPFLFIIFFLMGSLNKIICWIFGSIVGLILFRKKKKGLWVNSKYDDFC